MAFVIGPAVAAELRPLLTELVEAIRSLQTGGRPARVFSCPSSSLPPAAEFTSCVALATDLGVLVVSDGEGWTRQDTGTAI